MMEGQPLIWQMLLLNRNRETPPTVVAETEVEPVVVGREKWSDKPDCKYLQTKE